MAFLKMFTWCFQPLGVVLREAADPADKRAYRCNPISLMRFETKSVVRHRCAATFTKHALIFWIRHTVRNVPTCRKYCHHKRAASETHFSSLPEIELYDWYPKYDVFGDSLMWNGPLYMLRSPVKMDLIKVFSKELHIFYLIIFWFWIFPGLWH